MTYREIQKDLYLCSSDHLKEVSARYFKLGEGGYSAHDEFIGVDMPTIRKISKQHRDVALKEVGRLLVSKIHEERLCALIILVNRAKDAVKNDDGKELEEVTLFYMDHKQHVNNWDLVDVSAHYILGNYIILNPEKSTILYDLAQSDSLWDRRIAMVSQWIMIRHGIYDHVLPLAKILLDDKEDLMHKAVGWMLREYWKRDSEAVENFLEKNYKNLPRTTLRYAIEKVEEQRRRGILKGEF